MTKGELERLETEASVINAKARQARTLVKIAESFKDSMSQQSLELLLSSATEIMMGRPLLPKPVEVKQQDNHAKY